MMQAEEGASHGVGCCGDGCGGRRGGRPWVRLCVVCAVVVVGGG